jgi:predicted nucleic acid-binding Zn ribbon protein
MPTYTYETIPQKAGTRPVQFELQQSMKDAPLTQHPETGLPVRRVISANFAISGRAKQTSGRGHSCGQGCGCQ